jgi:hypothetical protein
MLFVGSTFYLQLVNATYEDAALGESDEAVLMVFTIILVFMGLIALFMLFLDGSARTRRVIFQGMLLFIAIGFLFVALTYGKSEIAASFRQRLAVLSPHLTDQECKQLQAQWATIHSREDYLILVAAMESTAKEKNVTLPKLRP